MRTTTSIKYRGPTVILDGGPCDGWVYYVDDWNRRVAAETYAGRSPRYRRTSRKSSRSTPLEAHHVHDVWEYGP